MVEAVEEYVNSGAQPAERMIRDLIDCEHSYINTDHPDFIGGSRAIAQVRLSPPGYPGHVCNSPRLVNTFFGAMY